MKTQFKSFIVLIAALFLVSFSHAQSPPAPGSATVPVASTPAPTVQGGIQTVIDAFKTGETNWFFEMHGLYAPALEKKYGGGIGAFHPMSQYVLGGVRLDYVNGGFWMPSGNATFQVPLKLTSWLQVTPLAYAGIGIPVSGAQVGNFKVPGKVHDNNGNATAILGEGFAVKLWDRCETPITRWYQFKKLDIAVDRENWSGFPGAQYRLAVVINKPLGGLPK